MSIWCQDENRYVIYQHCEDCDDKPCKNMGKEPEKELPAEKVFEKEGERYIFHDGTMYFASRKGWFCVIEFTEATPQTATELDEFLERHVNDGFSISGFASIEEMRNDKEIYDIINDEDILNRLFENM